MGILVVLNNAAPPFSVLDFYIHDETIFPVWWINCRYSVGVAQKFPFMWGKQHFLTNETTILDNNPLKKPWPADNFKKYKRKQIPKTKVIFQLKI